MCYAEDGMDTDTGYCDECNRSVSRVVDKCAYLEKYSKLAIEELCPGEDVCILYAARKAAVRIKSLERQRGEAVALSGELSKALSACTLLKGESATMDVERTHLKLKQFLADIATEGGGDNCERCGGQGWVYWDHDDPVVEATVRAQAPCPECAEGSEYE